MSMHVLRYVLETTKLLLFCSDFVFSDQRAVRDRKPKLLQLNPTIPSSLVQLDSLSTSVYNWS